MNQLSYAVARARTTAVSVQASESRIRDANMARELAGLTKSKMLTESGLAALSYANISARSVLKLLG